MKKKRFYYAIVSFMQKDNPTTCAKYGMTTMVEGKETEDELKFYPLMKCLKGAEERFKDIAIAGTIMLESVIEISEKDYNDFCKTYVKEKI